MVGLIYPFLFIINRLMGQNICEQTLCCPDVPAQRQDQAEIQYIPKTIKLQPILNVLADQPHPLFATPLQNTSFPLPTNVQHTLNELNPFIYSEGPDVPQGKTLLYPYLLHNGAIYAGDWKGGKMHGKGFFVLPDKSLLTCTMNDNVMCRKARIIYPNGDYYEGEVSNNRADGKGKLVEGRVTYIGEFKDNRPHGKGQQIGEGYSFEGQYQAAEKKSGMLTWKQDGQTFTYKGTFKDNVFDGKGTLVTKDGRYTGQFQKGEKSGLGKFYYKNKRYYQGEFKNDKRHGEGKIIDEQKSLVVSRGEWRDDIFVE